MHISKKAILSITISLFIIIGASNHYARQYNLQKEAAAVVKEILPPLSLKGEYWLWEKMISNDGTNLVPDTHSFVLTLSKIDNTVTSTTDCNSLSSTYILNGEVLSFAPFTATKMACKKSFEKDYTEALELATSYVITDNTLRINLNRDKGTMLFTRIKKEEHATSTNIDPEL